LRAAGGTVRCGICSSSFNAIEHLNEQPIPRQGDEPSFEDTITVEEVHGTEFIELSAAEGREDEAGPTPVQGGKDLDEVQDADLEFHGSAQDLERLFVSVDPLPGWPTPSAEAASTQTTPAGGDAEFEQAILRVAEGEFSGIEVLEQRFPEGLEHTDTHPGQVAAILAFPPPGEWPAADDQTSSEAGAAAATAGVPDAQPAGAGATEAVVIHDLDRTDEYPMLVLEGEGTKILEPGEDVEPAGALPAAPAAPEETSADLLPLAVTDGAEDHADQADEAADETLVLLIPEELRRGRPAAAEQDFEPGVEPGPGPRRWHWLLLALALLLALTAQAVHFWRDDLSRNRTVGPWLMRAYAALGLSLSPPIDLSAFELRQLGAASDSLQAGRIKLRASIVNHAGFAQPLPLLRLSLQDRFGSTIGTRDLEPAEYLPGGDTPASRLLGPGQRADAEVVFVDPGRDAVGFELDLCQREGSSIRCSDSGEAGK
jgi:hypothetical protein